MYLSSASVWIKRERIYLNIMQCTGWGKLQIRPVHRRLLGLPVAGTWKPAVLGRVRQLHQLLARHLGMLALEGLHRHLQRRLLDHRRALNLGDLRQRLGVLVGMWRVRVPGHNGAATPGHRHGLHQALATDGIALHGARGKLTKTSV